MPAITLAKLPTVDITFTSTPKQIRVRIANVGTKTTPFTVALPKDTNVSYQAFSSKDGKYAGESGTLTVTRKQNYGINLSLRPITVRFTSLPQQVKVDIPGEGVKTTPFAISVAPNKVLNFRAFTEDGRYKSKRGSVDVRSAEARTSRIVLTPIRVTVKFTSKPEGVSVTLPELGVKKTPFTASIQRNTSVMYRAFVKDNKSYENKSGTINFSKDSNYKIVLARARVRETTRQSNQQPQQEPSSDFTPAFVKAHNVGADRYLFEVVASYDFDKIDCGSDIESNLQRPEIYGVQCFYTSLGRETARQLIEVDIQYGRDNGWMAYFSGWVEEDDGSLTGNIDNYDEEDTAARLYVIPAEGGGTYITAYSLYQ